MNNNDTPGTGPRRGCGEIESNSALPLV